MICNRFFKFEMLKNSLQMYLKAYYRRAAAHMSLGKYKLALRDYERVYKARPNDKDSKNKFTECKKIVQVSNQ